MEKIILEFIAKYNKNKENFLRECFKDRGFENHFTDIEKQLFPKIARQYQNGWECWYAQDDNGEGIFIVGIKDVEPSFDYDSIRGCKLIREFKYTKEISELKL